MRKLMIILSMIALAMMPIAAKMLFSKKKLKEDEELIRSLKISKDDIRLMKLYNMMAVT